jgi:opacity protein-like surface antigen
MKIRAAALFALVLAFGLPAAGHAQLGAGLGAHAGYDFDAEEVLIGASFRFEIVGVPIGGNPLTIVPGIDFYPGVDGTLLFLDLDGQVSIPVSGVEPYVGAGVFLRYISVDAPIVGSVSDSDWGFNLLGGVAFEASEQVKPFVEGRGRITEESTVVVRGGIRFKFGM